jgi:hypothetical protein
MIVFFFAFLELGLTTTFFLLPAVVGVTGAAAAAAPESRRSDRRRCSAKTARASRNERLVRCQARNDVAIAARRVALARCHGYCSGSSSSSGTAADDAIDDVWSANDIFPWRSVALEEGHVLDYDIVP